MSQTVLTLAGRGSFEELQHLCWQYLWAGFFMSLGGAGMWNVWWAGEMLSWSAAGCVLFSAFLFLGTTTQRAKFLGALEAELQAVFTDKQLRVVRGATGVRGVTH